MASEYKEGERGISTEEVEDIVSNTLASVLHLQPLSISLKQYVVTSIEGREGRGGSSYYGLSFLNPSFAFAAIKTNKLILVATFTKDNMPQAIIAFEKFGDEMMKVNY
eukprot:CAMPEP_0174256070 /NCGR_PEP_ID=MMETSP0439-20130205/5336_1 /TAXON_ID=0 /ORGANISM="Stereomyxa ramosa, Strain Chinc5" /LENGTH=107 /DNA_ID=CAMNT_0015338525 /DNA_START=205 /DNA_END=531 /DNA_ORIENTATION=+